MRNCSKLHTVLKMSLTSAYCNLSESTCKDNIASMHELIEEGSAQIKIQRGANVFYNPVQEFNRDLSVSVLNVASQQWSKEEQSKATPAHKFRILEALSATGLRSIRYAKEIPNVTEVVANDISESAMKIIESNIEHNNVGNIVHGSNFDAVELMFNSRHHKKRFQVVDLDPYGCPTQFLDTAVQCVDDGGFLLVTCTDMAVLCGNSPETCFVKYGAMSLRTKACHEMVSHKTEDVEYDLYELGFEFYHSASGIYELYKSLRIALQCIQSQASKYKRYIVPVISVSADFYIRVVVRIFTSAARCKEIASKLSMVYQCCGCHATHLQPLSVVKSRNGSKNSQHHFTWSPAPVVNENCIHCNGKHHMGGPIWSAPLYDLGFVREVVNVVENGNLNTKNRLLGMLNMILEELHDVPLYYDLPTLCSVLKSSTVPMMTFRSAVLNGGYRISYSHANKASFKTDAPMEFIWDVIRQWIKENSEKEKTHTEGSVAYNILSKTVGNNIDFSLRPDAKPLSKMSKMIRFQINPTPFWGPGTRCTSNLEKPEKKVRNQNKKKRKAKIMLIEDSNNKKMATGDGSSQDIS